MPAAEASSPISPVTGGPTRLVETFSTEVLVRRYRQDWGLDVSQAFGGRPVLELFRCEDTGYRFFHPAELAGEDAFYDQIGSEEFVAEHGGSPEWKGDWQLGLEQIQAGDRIIDVGCNDGGFLTRASKIASAAGLEGNAKLAARARDRGLDVSCGYVQDYADHHAGGFDKVFSFAVLEHVYDVRGYFSSLVKLLKPEGKLVISVPNSDPYFAAWSKYEPLNNPPHHIGYWNEGALRALGETMGMDVERMAPVNQADSIKLRVFRRAAYMARAHSGLGHLAAAEWLRIAAVSPIALLAELISRRRLAGDIVVVYRRANPTA